MRPVTTKAAAFAAALLFVALISARPAAAAVCGSPVPYPGDAAEPKDIANWMANGAVALNLPGELPVMAALVESGMKNLNYGDADSVGYFQMRTGIWNSGAYAGYPTNPDLQLKWFTDQSTKVRQQRLGSGGPDPASSELLFGEWIADVERPAEQYRGRYQLRLAEARQLIAYTCPNLQGGDLTAPTFHARTPKHQHPLRSKAISFVVLCPTEACNVSATASIKLPGAARASSVAADTLMLGPGSRRTIKLKVSSRLRAKIKSALVGGRRVRARVRIRVADGFGNGTVKISKVRLLR